MLQSAGVSDLFLCSQAYFCCLVQQGTRLKIDRVLNFDY
jgi:hypothetical protein